MLCNTEIFLYLTLLYCSKGNSRAVLHSLQALPFWLQTIFEISTLIFSYDLTSRHVENTDFISFNIKLNLENFFLYRMYSKGKNQEPQAYRNCQLKRYVLVKIGGFNFTYISLFRTVFLDRFLKFCHKAQLRHLVLFCQTIIRTTVQRIDQILILLQFSSFRNLSISFPFQKFNSSLLSLIS